MSSPAEAPAYRHVYLHVPFCGRRCSYCDFAIAIRKTVPVSEFADAIMAEAAIRGERPHAMDLRTLYLGGGTPSKLGGPGLRGLLDRFAQSAGVDSFSTSAPDFELTIEVNPEDVTEQAVAEWRAAGVNRASVGGQSFDPAVLAWMHREHSPEATVEAFRLLRAGGISNLSLDLIFAVPGHLGRDWARDLDLALALGPDHLSFYGLTIEPHTPLGRWAARGEVAEAPEERYESEFLLAHDRLTGAGLDHYEVSNYALPGRRAVHNSAYWSGVPYLGLGPSAHGFDGSVRRWNRRAYADWLRTVQQGLDPVEGQETLTVSDRASERIYLGLRTTDGLELRQNELKTVSRWIEAGWGVLLGGRLVLTPSGWLRLDSLAPTLAAASRRTP